MKRQCMMAKRNTGEEQERSQESLDLYGGRRRGTEYWCSQAAGLGIGFTSRTQIPVINVMHPSGIAQWRCFVGGFPLSSPKNSENP